MIKRKGRGEYEKLKNAKITDEWNQIKKVAVWHEEPKAEKTDAERTNNADWDDIRAASVWHVPMHKIDFRRAESLEELEDILNMLEFRVGPDNPNLEKLRKYLEL